MGRHSNEPADSGHAPGRPGDGQSGAAADDFGFEHRKVRSSRRGALLWGLGALVVVAALVTGFVVWRTVGSGACHGERTSVTVAADPTIASALRDSAATVSANSCYDYSVDSVAGSAAPGLLTSGDQRPDLWVPDSQLQARRVITQVRQELDLTSPSLVSTPTVVVGKNVPQLSSWEQVMKLPDLRAGSPVDTSSGDAPIVGALAEVNANKLTEDQLLEGMTVLAVQQNNVRLTNDSEGTRLNLANASDVPAVTTEQQYVMFMRTHPGSQLKFAIPADGTVLLDYPLVNTAGSARKGEADDAGKALAAGIAGNAAQPLADAAFRLPNGKPAGGEHPYGTGQPVQVLTLRDPAEVDKALRQWQVLGVPIRTLVVEDTSGSMQQRVGSETRAQLLIDASLQGLKLFPNNAEIGGWAFSQNRGPGGQDWVQLSDIRRLDAPAANGKTHRDELAAAVTQGLAPQNLGGATGLYDTTLAAFKQVQSTYDPTYSNSVIIMTDGENEDPGSISLDELITELKKLEDPARPVLVLTIGISSDADTDALKQIADATGGTSYVAKTADDISSVFVNAIQARVAAAGR
ncbi:substrate-binding and VWA domain-containing protein [Gordonia polyisoprenivorans]|uniref:substrate-binding and VWA domain-containing protein n=1 Tax=Gordonia polyisoprenivorans TaxID=84595 RepID=UPI001A03A85F|nr:substrate-binding and VWA domain-containing protein [uncultured Gordonia sp.]MBE7192002.1 substrate-binding domain-containing protein [Gordonia polyisoprenivorans]UZF55254.1 substrate-binding and VWA domain-containing protein [Gordonia polyisoprenivorans]